MMLLSQGPVFWRLFCLSLSLHTLSHAPKTDTLADRQPRCTLILSASRNVVLHAEQTSLSSKPYYCFAELCY